MNDGSVANMSTDKIDPATGANYAAGPWNNAGIDNLQSVSVSVGALAYVANPGTGLTRINRSDGIWLHTTGRLANGADFQVVTRDVYSGTANTAANNLGLDISWSVGENDDNNGNAADGGTTRSRIGPGIKFSKKTSGGQQVRPTVQNARMSFGHLSSADSVSLATNNSSRPMRTLDFRDDDNDVADGSNNLLPAERRNNRPFADPIAGSDANLDINSGFTRLTAKSIVEGSYGALAPLTYVFVKRPDAVNYNNPNKIKGDNDGDDVVDVRNNIFNAIANFPPTSISNPADQMLQSGFMLPQFAKVRETIDRLNSHEANPNYNAALSAAFLGSTYAANFTVADPSSITTGTGSTYGNNNIGAGSATPVGGAIPINDKNWLFGDFDQRGAASGVSGKGVRDYSDLAVAQQAQAALQASGQGVDWNVNAGSNAQVITGLPTQLTIGGSQTLTKGDLIVLGDYDADGDFDGKDLYHFGRGASLADNPASTVLTAASGADFGDRVRRGVLRKNAALDWLHANATSQQKLEATASAVNDPTGANAFNKFDVNRDGMVSRRDAKIVDQFIGKDYRNLDDQTSAVTEGVAGLISLVDVELNDTGTITHVAPGAADQSDTKLVVYNLQGRDVTPSRTGNEVDGINRLLNGDANFDGAVNDFDFSALATNFGGSGKKWSGGDFNFDGNVNDFDFSALATNFGKTLAGGSPAPLPAESWEQLAAFGASIGVQVPEPGALGVIAIGALATLRRRTRR
jgi:hypothetical protein